MDENRQELSKINYNEFSTNFDSDGMILSEYVNYAKATEFKLSDKTKKSLQNYLKSTIARDLYNDEALYKVMQSEDQMIKKVLELEAN